MVFPVQTGDALMTLKQASAKRQKLSDKKEEKDSDATDEEDDDEL